MSRACLSALELADFAADRIATSRRETAAEHVAGCVACTAALARVRGAQATLREIAELPAPTLTAAGSARLEAALRWTRPTPRVALWSWRWLLAGSLAAAAAAGLLAWKLQLHHAAANTPTQLAERAPTATTPAPAIAPQAPTAQPLQAIVTLVGGEARLRRDSREAPLDAKTRLVGRDTLLTAATGRVGIQWGEGSGALVRGSSRLSLVRLERRAQELGLEQGAVAVRVGPHQVGESLRVTTPDHVVTVHGTWFVVAAEARGTTVEVLEGVVEVARPDGSETTRLAAPERAFFPRGSGLAEGSRPLTAREAAALRAASEPGLLPSTFTDGADSLVAATGLYALRADPPANVAVDGVSFGTSPIELRRLTGRHLVELSRPGFATVSRWISVGPEEGELHTALPAAPRSGATPDDTAEVAQMVAARSHQVEACYEHQLKLDPGLSGTVELKIQIGGDGQVVATNLGSDTIADPAVAECLRREAAGWTFAHARTVTVVYPFTFRPTR